MPAYTNSKSFCDGFEAPSPAEIEAIRQENGTIHSWAGVTIVRLSPKMIVKYGAHVDIVEAKSMIFVKQNTKGVPVPEVFGHYSYGPHSRDVEDFGSLYDTYIFMSFAIGETLEEGWETYGRPTKLSIAAQLHGHFIELRNVQNVTWIGSVDHGGVKDPLLSRAESKGPFSSERDFNDALIRLYQQGSPNAHIRSFLTGTLSEKQHRNCFTHGDLRPANIVVSDGIVSAILDWEFSGWYPEYWEFVRAFQTWRWQNDWTDYLLTILQPYYSEYGAYSLLAERLFI